MCSAGAGEVVLEIGAGGAGTFSTQPVLRKPGLPPSRSWFSAAISVYLSPAPRWSRAIDQRVSPGCTVCLVVGAEARAGLALLLGAGAANVLVPGWAVALTVLTCAVGSVAAEAVWATIGEAAN
ncbi:hypothetical protein ATK17_3875, partial [Branchiibius hedensis]